MHVSRLRTAGVFRDEEESVSPLYLIEELIGILMPSGARLDLFSNQEVVMQQRVDGNEVGVMFKS